AHRHGYVAACPWPSAIATHSRSKPGDLRRSRFMNCEEFHRVMHPYADDELDPLRSAEAEQHLQSCSACAAAYENLLALKRSTSAAFFTAPDELVGAVRSALRRARTSETFIPRRDFRPWLLSGLAIAASVLLGFFLGQNLLRRSSDQVLLAEMIDSH